MIDRLTKVLANEKRWGIQSVLSIEHLNRTAFLGPVFGVNITDTSVFIGGIDFEKSNYKYKSLNCSTVYEVAYTRILNNSCPLRNGP